MFNIAIDTGGTFTDGIAIDNQGKINTVKFPTNAAGPANSIMGCVKLLAEELLSTEQKLLSKTSTVVVGTTLATNSVVEKTGAKCCLLYTKGFRDIPELGRRIPKTDIYNAHEPPPEVLIPRHLRFGVEERIRHDGKILTPLKEGDVRDAVEKAKKHGIEVPVICFLNSYANPENEEKAAEIVRKEFPDVVVSAHVLQRWIEWDRLTTAALAGYVKPVLRRFITSLEEQLKKANFKGNLLFITCAGGVATPEICLDNPALLIGSGPAAGPLLGQLLAESNGFNNAIVYDMGGTSLDVSILPNRTILTTTETTIGDYRSGCEAVEISTLGAGGGSIAWIDDRGILRVGPASAGADPGPACYGKGGKMPTVTDADVVLGRIPADYFLGGKIALEGDLAKKAINDVIAQPLGMDVIQAAHAIISLVEANMAEMVLLSTVRKGFDPREFKLIVGGGAGAAHAVGIAERLGVKDIYVPKHAALFCALGIAIAEYKHILSRILLQREDEVHVEKLKNIFDALKEEGAAVLARQGVAESKMRFIFGAEMRYSGQMHDIEVLLPAIARNASWTESNFQALIQGFHENHKVVYGYSNPDLPTVLATLKLQALGKRTPVKLAKQPFSGKDASGALKRTREAYFKELGGFVKTPCYDAEQLKHGNVVVGPAIIEHPTTTVVLPQGAELKVDAYENYEIARVSQ